MGMHTLVVHAGAGERTLENSAGSRTQKGVDVCGETCVHTNPPPTHTHLHGSEIVLPGELQLDRGVACVWALFGMFGQAEGYRDV